MAVWHVQPIFVASTFDDMQWERDHVRRVVVPDVQSRLRAKGHRIHIELIDLRWGVDTTNEQEARAKELQIIQVCLHEVRRSRPFLIGLLGDRYGWVPPEGRLRRLAEDAGVADDVEGRSVTDLELTFGTLHDAGRPSRALVYSRRLDFREIDPTRAAFLSDERGGRNVDGQKLQALKSRLHRSLGPERFQPYALRWDTGRDAPRSEDVSRWGLKLAGDLEKEFDEDLRLRAVRGSPDPAAPLSRHADERWAVEQFFEDAARWFAGRQTVLDDLSRFLVSSAASDPDSMCVVGPPGAGKTALLGKVAADGRSRLGFVCLLLGAAGAGVEARSPLQLLRGWAGELSEALGEPGAANDGEDVQKAAGTFAHLLRRVSATHRVVIILDGLDELESAVGTDLHWLPDPLPPGVRLLTSAASGYASAAFARRTNAEIRHIAPLSLTDAEAIAAAICRRYGESRTMNPLVMNALVATKAEAGDPPWSNPLWLTTAVEELNQLDADEYRQSRTKDVASPEERLLDLLVQVAGGLPPALHELLVRMRRRAEAVCTPGWTTAVLESIALSRTGLRTQELQLALAAAGESWDELRFAQLRRVFGSHLVQRGAGQWAFANEMARAAASTGVKLGSAVRQDIHESLARHFLRLPASDPLRPFEVLGCIRAAGLQKEAVEYLATALTPHALNEAADTLIESRAIGEGSLEWAVSLIGPDTVHLVRAPLIGQLARILLRAKASRAISLDSYLELMSHLVGGVFMAAQSHIDDDLLVAISAADLLNEYGRAFFENGDLEAARSQFEQAWSFFQMVLTSTPDNVTAIRNAVRALDGLARLSTEDDPGGPGSLHVQGVELMRRAMALDPSDIQLARDLGSSLNLLAQVHLESGRAGAAAGASHEASGWIQRALGAEPSNPDFLVGAIHARNGEGDALLADKNLPGAIEAFERALDLCDRLLQLDPKPADWQLKRAQALCSIGDTLAAMEKFTDAERRYDESSRIRMRLYEDFPESNEIGLAAALISDRLGDVLLRTGRAHAAIREFEKALRIRDSMLSRDPGSIKARLGRSASLEAIGVASRATGMRKEALDRLEESVAVRRTLADDFRGAETSMALARALLHLGDARHDAESVDGARQAFEECLAVLASVEQAGFESQSLRDLMGGVTERLSALRSGGAVDIPVLGSVRIPVAPAEPADGGESRSFEEAIARARSLVESGDARRKRGDAQSALGDYEQGIAILRAAMRDGSVPAQMHIELAKLLARAGAIWRASGRLEEARSAIRESTDVRRAALAATHHPVLLEGLCSSLRELRGVSREAGDLAEALSASEEELACRRALVRLQPGDDRSTRALLVTCFERGELLARTGNAPAAVEAFEEARSTFEVLRLASRHPLGLVGDAGALFSSWADSLIGAGNLEEAVRVLDLGVQELRRQTEALRRDPASRASLLALLYRSGVAQHMSGNLARARDAGLEAESLARELMEEAPNPNVEAAANAVAMLMKQINTPIEPEH